MKKKETTIAEEIGKTLRASAKRCRKYGPCGCCLLGTQPQKPQTEEGLKDWLSRWYRLQRRNRGLKSFRLSLNPSATETSAGKIISEVWDAIHSLDVERPISDLDQPC